MNLTLSDLTKLNKSTNELRSDILLKLIESNSPIQLNDQTFVILDSTQNSDICQILKTNNVQMFEKTFKQSSKYIPVFVGMDKQKYRLIDFLKSEQFKGTSKIVVSSKTTLLQESAHAILLGLSFYLKRKLIPSDVNLDNFILSENFVDINEKTDEVFNFIISDHSWLNSCLLSVNCFFEFIETNKQLIVHHQSSLVKQLFKLFNTLNKQEKEFSNSNKWNPSDIWVIDKNISYIPTFSSLSDLNTWLKCQFESKSIVGISLKKVLKSSRIKIHDPSSVTSQEYDITLITSKTTSLFNSKDCFITLNRHTQIQFRNFSDASIQGEIKGPSASHGKVGFGNINNTLTKHNIPPLTPINTIKTLFKENFDELVNTIIHMSQTIQSSLSFEIPTNWNIYNWVSKFQAVELLFKIFSNPKKQQSIVNDIFRTASSLTPMSSIFIKM